MIVELNWIELNFTVMKLSSDKMYGKDQLIYPSCFGWDMHSHISEKRQARQKHCRCWTPKDLDEHE